MTETLRWSCPGCRRSLGLESPDTVRCSGCGTEYRSRGGIWRGEDVFEPSGFSAERRDLLLELERDHFWFRPRLDLLTRLLRRVFPFGRPNLVELGCGSGAFLYAAQGIADIRVGVDGHCLMLEHGAKRGGRAWLIHADAARVPLESDQFDVAVALDVLEHVEPSALLSEACRLVKRRGKLLVSVPAFDFLWSRTDEAAGHRSRYNIEKIKRELDATGWELSGYTHYQFLLFPAVAISRWINRNSTPKLERSPGRWVNRAARAINDLEVRLLNSFKLPFGSSLIVWAEKGPDRGLRY